MEYWKIEHNKPISIAIKGYIDKKSGKVTESRKEIERRFDGLDWRYQKQILFGFLQSGATDREWAYRKLFACWDECFITTLQELWERYHEKTLSWLVIRFFPTGYVKEHLEELSEGRNYFFIYERLAEDKDFNLDKTRLNEADLLSVKRKQQETITDDDFEDLFYLLIYKICKGAYSIRRGKIFEYHGENPIISLFDNRILKRMMDEAVYYYNTAEKLRKWIYMVSKDYLRSYKTEIDFDYPYPKREQFDRIAGSMREICYKHIPTKYTTVWDAYDISDQQKFLDDLDRRHKKHLQKRDLKHVNVSFEEDLIPY